MSGLSKYYAHHSKFSEPEGQTLRTQLLFFQVEKYIFFSKKNDFSIYFETVKFCFLNNSLKTGFFFLNNSLKTVQRKATRNSNFTISQSDITSSYKTFYIQKEN